jgi:hypothetical protein
VSIKQGAPRSTLQNQLSWKWYQEAAEQLQEYTPDEYRAWCKLHIGVPILRGEDNEYREAYDLVIKPLSYERKMALMGEPLSYPVTSMMSTKQFTLYLDRVYAHFTGLGVRLTEPDSPPAAPAEGKDGPSQPVPQEEPVSAPQTPTSTYEAIYQRLVSATTPESVESRWRTNERTMRADCTPEQIKQLELTKAAWIEELRMKANAPA